MAAAFTTQAGSQILLALPHGRLRID